ncbi:putative Qa-SNARE protein [Trypanosoma theileri]|uniref:Putative Qa-SNARE protein n=1 Tax=Trypanosoma theileri TaxID=67003 RepID=A0A1X0NPE1_9TRYP|nr:putative Qa-SNARE protein [Trypanosoma theileri]ORC86576.1 putative Qa-SNARE protein [Trypanosoma theileri]
MRGTGGKEMDQADHVVESMKRNTAAGIGGNSGNAAHTTTSIEIGSSSNNGKHNSYNTSGMNHYSDNNNSNNNKFGEENPTVVAARSNRLAAETNANLLRALRMSEATNDTGYSTLQQLGRQRECIGRTIESVDGTREELMGARRVIRDIRLSVYREWAVKGLVLVVLLLLDILLFYMKFIRRR